MQNRDNYLTVAIIGQPRRLVLGQQVRFDEDPRFEQTTKDWRTYLKGKLREMRLWEQRLPAAPAVYPHSGSKWIRLGLGAVAMAVAGFWASSWMRDWQSTGRESATQLAKMPAAAVSEPVKATAANVAASVPLPLSPVGDVTIAAGSVIHLVDADAPMPLPMDRGGQILVAKAEQGVSTPNVKVTPSVTPTAQVKPQAQTELPSKDKENGEKALKAVVVDDPVTVNASKGLPSDGQAKVIAAPAQRPGAAPAPAQVKPKLVIVDIPKSAKYVLITDPQTRLPKKYIQGDKIFTGETIKTIDGEHGKVVLDARIVSME